MVVVISSLEVESLAVAVEKRVSVSSTVVVPSSAPEGMESTGITVRVEVRVSSTVTVVVGSGVPGICVTVVVT